MSSAASVPSAFGAWQWPTTTANWSSAPAVQSPNEPLNHRHPKERAARILERRRVETQVRAAVQWVHEVAGRTAPQAIASAKFPLVSSVDSLRYAIEHRNKDGSPWQRRSQEILTDDELDALIGRYRAAGFRGGCSAQEVKLLQDGAVQLIKARAPPERYTDAELRILRPGATPVSKGWCQMVGEMVKILESRELARDAASTHSVVSTSACDPADTSIQSAAGSARAPPSSTPAGDDRSASCQSPQCVLMAGADAQYPQCGLMPRADFSARDSRCYLYALQQLQSRRLHLAASADATAMAAQRSDRLAPAEAVEGNDAATAGSITRTAATSTEGVAPVDFGSISPAPPPADGYRWPWAATLPVQAAVDGSRLSLRTPLPPSMPAVWTDSETPAVVGSKRSRQVPIEVEAVEVECVPVRTVAPPETVLETIRCCICMDTFVDPHLISACSHSFCRDCIHRHLHTRGNEWCPRCRGPARWRDVLRNHDMAAIVAAILAAYPA